MTTLEPADDDLDFIKDLMHRTSERIDPRGFHFVHWGLIVLIWYPLSNFFEQRRQLMVCLGLGIGALVLGFMLSALRERALRDRLRGDNTFVGRQIGYITAGCLVMGFVLSGVTTSSGFIADRNVPILWGLVYAILTFMVGVVYRRDFLVAGMVIFLGTVLAMFFDKYNGYILGPFMGLGMIIPGLRAESRVRRLREDKLDETATRV